MVRLQGLYTEMKFERPSKIQAVSLPMILTPPYRSLVAQARLLLLAERLHWAPCQLAWTLAASACTIRQQCVMLKTTVGCSRAKRTTFMVKAGAHV